ncbi:phage gene 29 protein family protein [Nocardia terpenica]|uniref:DUF2744 domain-containing protein n=1 Tax=Nocardia terpenica TaxID=455432 RepID=A0A291RCW4_9NOCA|nr:DUF2744 domain-containing protein [Nocardia terpenica]ATL65150.1 hypothetical protein CRH09_01790 [Nocardia terpenica]
MTFWSIDSIDPADPEQRFLPALQAIPIMGRTPIIFPEPIARAISKHLTEAGCPPMDASLAVKKFQRPYRGEQTVFNPAGQWVDIDAPEPEPVVIQDPAAMTVREREAQVERLRYLGYRINDPEPATPTAKVVDTLDTPPRFDPAAHSVREVNTYLRELGEDDPLERRRVLHAERQGKGRNGILKRHQKEGA